MTWAMSRKPISRTQSHKAVVFKVHFKFADARCTWSITSASTEPFLSSARFYRLVVARGRLCDRLKRTEARFMPETELERGKRPDRSAELASTPVKSVVQRCSRLSKCNGMNTWASCRQFRCGEGSARFQFPLAATSATEMTLSTVKGNDKASEISNA